MMHIAGSVLRIILHERPTVLYFYSLVRKSGAIAPKHTDPAKAFNFKIFGSVTIFMILLYKKYHTKKVSKMAFGLKNKRPFKH